VGKGTNFPIQLASFFQLFQVRLEDEYLFISNACLLVTFVPCFDCPFFWANFG